MKCSKYRGVSQKRWCVLTEERIYFFESFWASKYSSPTEAIPWSRVIFARYAYSASQKRTLSICCKSRLLGIRSVHVDLFGGGDDMDSTWSECLAKLDGVSVVTDLEERKAKACAQVSDAVDASSRTSTMSTCGTGLRRIPKMSQIAPQSEEEAPLSADASETSSCLDLDGTDSFSSGSIASDAFIEDADCSGFSFAFQYGKEMSCADLCANYQLSKACPSISTMDSDPALEAVCDGSSCMASGIGDEMSDILFSD
jgi:hypothetical protein